MSKQEYFSYFHNHHLTLPPEMPQSQSAHESRPKTSHYCINKSKKLLPHIVEEYQYRITNQLLQDKIQHPKRDKLIAQSFSQHSHKPSSKRKPKGRSEQKQKDSKKVRRDNKKEGSQRRDGKTCQVERQYKTFDDLGSSCYNYKNDYLISLQNTRMGRRLINTRSMVQDFLTKTYYTYQMYNGNIVNKDHFLKINRKSLKFRSCNKGFGKINNGIKCFFNPPTHPTDSPNTANNSSFDRIRETQKSSSLNNHGYETTNPLILETYGHGSLNFVITRLLLDCNPPLKPDCCLLLQVIQKDQRLAKVLTNYYAERNNFASHICPTEHPQDDSRDCHTTAPFPYQYIAAEGGGFGLKFRLKNHSFIYLRLIKVEGLEQRELGVVKVDLQPFRNRTGGEQPFEIVKQSKTINGVDHERQVFQSEFVGHLYRFKKGEIAATLRFQYQLYQRAFIPLEQSNDETCA